MMPRAYINDLRWRAIWLTEFLGYNAEEVAFLLSISVSTVQRYQRSFLALGQIDSQRIGRSFGAVEMHPHEQLVLMEAVLEHPEKTLNELVNQIYAETGSIPAVSAIHYYLRRNGLTRKKARKYDINV